MPVKALFETGFELIVTTDQNLRRQQNLADRRLAILVLRRQTGDGSRTVLVTEAVDAIAPGAFGEPAVPAG